jgi:hypothetical protein
MLNVAVVPLDYRAKANHGNGFGSHDGGMYMKRFAVFGLLAALTGSLLLAPTSPAAAETVNAEPVKNTFKNIPVTGSVAGGGTFDGMLTITRFEAQGDEQLVAHGVLSGVLNGLPNDQTREVQNQAVVWPVKRINGQELPQTRAALDSENPDVNLLARLDSTSEAGLQQVPPTPGSCPILTLDLGPLDLDLLGLRVALNEVNLLIEAIPGGGELLGNLLCAVAGLLDPGGFLPGVLGQIADILNQIIQIIGLLG